MQRFTRFSPLIIAMIVPLIAAMVVTSNRVPAVREELRAGSSNRAGANLQG